MVNKNMKLDLLAPTSHMATTGNGSANESGGEGVNFRKRSFHPEFNEDPQNISQEAGQHNSSGVSELSIHQGGNIASISITVGKSELEQIVKQMTFTCSEAQRLIALVQSRTIEEKSQSSLLLTKSGSLKKHKHGDETQQVEDNIRTGHGQASREDSSLINSNATQHPTTIQSLPDELLSNIFIRLLAKQLAQMRSVSKSWNAFLSHSSFVNSHLHRSIHYNDQILLTFYTHNDYIEPFTTHSCKSPHIELPNFIKLPVSPQPEYTRITVIGSVNGLICSSYIDSVIQVWNPSLSTVLNLPPYFMHFHGYNSMKIFVRFGYDPKTDDYKVLKLIGLTGVKKFTIRCWLQVEIYSMRKGCWKLIPERFPAHITGISCDCIVSVDGCDGRLHWHGGCRRGEKYVTTIVAFDLGLETFREIPMPNVTLGHDCNCVTYLGLLGGKLCVMSADNADRVEVWVMDEYGVAESWVKCHVFSKFFGVYRFTFGCTSRYVFLIDTEGCLVLYDPIADKETIFESFYVIEEGAEKIVEYVDSLVWATPIEQN